MNELIESALLAGILIAILSIGLGCLVGVCLAWFHLNRWVDKEKYK